MKQSTQRGDTQNGKQPKEVVVQNEPQAKERTSEKIAEENNVGIYQPTRTHEMKRKRIVATTATNHMFYKYKEMSSRINLAFQFNKTSR